MRHILPIGGSQPHYQATDCPCRPKVIEGDEWDYCIHKSFDGREVIIAAEIAIGIRCEDCFDYINEKGEPCDPPPIYEEY